MLPAIPTSRNAIQLEVVFAERPAGDPLLGETLWNEVDQVSSLKAETRAALAEDGFRIGHCGSEPPRALEEMLGLHAEEAGGDRKKNLVGRRIVLASGAATELQIGDPIPECSVDVPGADGVETKTFQNARFLFRLTVERDQEGWARLEFLPEIHHGSFRLRRVAGENGWELRTAQDVFPLYALRFSMLLNVGEMAILSAEDGGPQSLSRHFFFGTGNSAGVQRVLVVRLAEMAKTDPIYGE